MADSGDDFGLDQLQKYGRLGAYCKGVGFNPIIIESIKFRLTYTEVDQDCICEWYKDAIRFFAKFEQFRQHEHEHAVEVYDLYLLDVDKTSASANLIREKTGPSLKDVFSKNFSRNEEFGWLYNWREKIRLSLELTKALQILHNKQIYLGIFS